MASSTSTGISHKTHYARLGHATQHLIPKFLKELLTFLEPTASIGSRCSKNAWLNKNLRQGDWDKIKAANKHGSYEHFDIPLIYTIFRNLHYKFISPSRGWDNLPGPFPYEIELGDDIERCRNTRNAIIHRGGTTVTDKELEEYFNEFRGIALRLQKLLKKSNNEFVDEIGNLLTCCMDEETEKKYLEDITDLREQDKAKTEALTKLEEEGRLKENEIQELKRELSRVSLQEATFEVIQSLSDASCSVGGEVVLTCSILGSGCVAKWFKDGNEIIYDRRIRQESKTIDGKEGSTVYLLSLVIPHISEEDAGNYSVQLGSETFDCNVTVSQRVPNLIDLRSYQEELVEVALTGRNTIICAGTNAGKTYVAYHIVEDHLIKHSKGKIVFINKTNVLLEQQYSRACAIFKDLFFQNKIYKWDASLEGECEPFCDIVRRVTLFFCTPKSLCNHLDQKSKSKVSLDEFTLVVLDECHHVVRRNPFNEIMGYYRRHKFENPGKPIPQIIGLTASPGTNKADSLQDAVEHLKKLMTCMDVSKLSVVRKNEEELLKYSSTPTKVRLRSESRIYDPVRDLLLKAIKQVEAIFNEKQVTAFLFNPQNNAGDLYGALIVPGPAPVKDENRYFQWLSTTKQKVESVMLKGDTAESLHLCIRNLELYADCLEMNSLLEVDHVIELLSNGYTEFKYQIQQKMTTIADRVVSILQDTLSNILAVRNTVEGNPDVNVIIQTLNEEYEKLHEDARFLIFVKTRTSAKALAKRLPDNFKASHLTGTTKSKDKAGLHIEEQLETMERFRDGEHLCIVATSVACEGLDIPKCNLMIRYKFKVDEISSYQMRGRIRNKDGKEVIVADTSDFEREDKNIRRQYYMKLAIESVIDLDLAQSISIAEMTLYKAEERERYLEELRSDESRKGEFLIHCKNCPQLVSDGIYLRHIRKKQSIICDVSILGRIKTTPIKKVVKFDAMKKIGHVKGPCGHGWGIILVHENCKFVTISRDKVNFYDKHTKDMIKFKKWPEFPYKIDELSQEEIYSYLEKQTRLYGEEQ